jgi:RNA polymerase sigma-70 factor (ECF subfamily)
MADPESLATAYQSRVFRYLCRAVGRAEVARDLTQEVFLRVARHSGSVNGDGGAWLFRIARNIVLDHYRAHARQPQPTPLVDQAARPAQQDVSAAVNEALGALPPLDRDVFLLREVAGLGYEDIAQTCELTPDAVRSRIHRTRLQLRERLAAPIATSRTTAMGSSRHSRGPIHE